MGTSEDRWFEVWSMGLDDMRPIWLLVVTPDKVQPQLVIVYDPQENYRVVHQGKGYKETCYWLQEDEFNLVGGREFPDDGLPLETHKRGRV